MTSSISTLIKNAQIREIEKIVFAGRKLPDLEIIEPQTGKVIQVMKRTEVMPALGSHVAIDDVYEEKPK